MSNATFTYDTIVIGGGQAGLATGYYLKQQGRDFVILDANERTGDSWRNRWDSLRLFTPGRYNNLPGMPFPAPSTHYPTKDEIADYLEAYTDRFHLPIILATRVESLTREGDRYIVSAGDRRFEASHVVVATGFFQTPRVPAFADDLDPTIVQIHSCQYRNPEQLAAGNTLVVGVGNSGAEIALELVQTKATWLSGRATGYFPGQIPPVVDDLIWLLFHRVLTIDTKIGRRFKALAIKKGAPVEGISEKDFERAGVKRLPRTVGVKDGKPMLADGRLLDVNSVVWATGFEMDFRWINLPVFDQDRHPIHYRGVVKGEPGLYFIGLLFLYTLTSVLIGGVNRDAEYIAEQIAARSATVARSQTSSKPQGETVWQSE